MSVVRIEIKNYRSIPKLDINISKTNCFIGINNVGKSTIMRALHFYYLNLTEEIKDNSIFNLKNPYIQEVEIIVHYSIERLMEMVSADEDNEYYQYIKTRINKYNIKNNLLTVSFKRFKNNTTKWSVDLKLREIIKRQFPFFYIESRQINLYDWGTLWDVLGQINPFKKRIDSSTVSYNLTNSDKELLDVVNSVFIENGITIKSSTIYEKITSIVQLQFGGKKFASTESSLEMSSFGYNSFTYIKLYISLVIRLFESKNLALPLIMIDEPEIHLHSKNIEKLVDSLINNESTKEIKCIFATHSASFIKNIIIAKNDTQIFQVSRSEKDEFVVSKMTDFRNNKKSKFMSDRESNLFFSVGCLFVEGDTEVELFSHDKLSRLFPVLKEYDIYNYDSKIDKLKLVNPNDRKLNTKYFLLLDMDKVINYEGNKNGFKPIKKEKYLNLIVNPTTKAREKYYYTDKYRATLLTRNRITSILNLSTFTLDANELLINERDLYEELISLIQKYFIEYNLFPVSSTIEGVIINKSNCDIFLSWLEHKLGNKTLFNRVFNTNINNDQRDILARMLFEGKTESLQIKKKLNPSIYNGNLGELKFELMRGSKNSQTRAIFNKTSGWVSDFLDYYFDNYIDFRKSLSHNREVFSADFPELCTIISKL